MAGDYSVSRVAEEAGLEPQHECRKAPEAAELFEDEYHRVGASQQMFIRLIGVNYDINRIQISGVCPMASEDAPRQRTLQRSKTKNARPIVTQDELVHPVAKPANAVVEQDGMGHGAS